MADSGSQSQKPISNERITNYLETLALTTIGKADDIVIELTGLSIRMLRILRIIDDNPGITFKKIVAITNLNPALVSRIIKSLRQKGFVDRVANDEDSRKYELATTSLGQKKRTEVRVVSNTLDAVLLSPLSDTEIANLFQSLIKLSQWTSSEQYEIDRLAAYAELKTSYKQNA